ncbi:MAG: class I SAM-dependent methyltransferase, partial [Candidatus Hodarchaeota archaeon]
MFTLDSTSGQCFYCQGINKVETENNYPLRTGIFSKEGIIYRCAWHAQFKCSRCRNFHHFSWFYWCPSTKELICGSCNRPTLTALKFWDRTYAYTFHCKECEKSHYDLLYSEFQGIHPWQQTELIQPNKLSKNSMEETIVSIINNPTPWLPIWKPLTIREGESISLEDALEMENTVIPIRKEMAKITSSSVVFHSALTPEDEISYEDSRIRWEDNSEIWIKTYDTTKEKDEGDINRQLIIDPALLKQIGDVTGLKVLDAGCGNGYFSRKLARQFGTDVIGVDHSQVFIDYCLNQEKQSPLGCKFHQGSLNDLSFLQSESFDLIISNVVMVDVIEYKKAFKELNRVLKPQGRFIWSNLHPVFGRLGNLTYRLPFDTQRNEERLFIMIDRYFDSGGTLLSWQNFSPLWQIDRTLTEYSKALKEAGFVISEIVEPNPSIENIKENPRLLAFDADRFPLFIIFD